MFGNQWNGYLSILKTAWKAYQINDLEDNLSNKAMVIVWISFSMDDKNLIKVLSVIGDLAPKKGIFRHFGPKNALNARYFFSTKIFFKYFWEGLVNFRI